MKYRVSFAVPPQVRPEIAAVLIQGQVLEAGEVLYHADGSVEFFESFAPAGSAVEATMASIVRYAAGVWRSVAEEGAFNRAIGVAPDETAGRKQQRR